MGCSDSINELIQQAVDDLSNPFTFYHFALQRTFLPYQPGPVYAVSDSVQGTMQALVNPLGTNFKGLVAGHVHWAPHANYLNEFTSLTLTQGGVHFEYSASSSGIPRTELVDVGCWGSADSLLLWGHEKQTTSGYQIGLPSQEVLLITKVVIDPSKIHFP
jgi:hypothetical protein